MMAAATETPAVDLVDVAREVVIYNDLVRLGMAPPDEELDQALATYIDGIDRFMDRLAELAGDR